MNMNGDRRSLIYEVKDKGRDMGKRFLLTEMPAEKAEAWAYRALLAIARSRPDMPEEYARLGLYGIAHWGMSLFSQLSWDEAKPLLDEMMSCVQMMPDPDRLDYARPGPVLPGEIAEMKTLVFLRKEVMTLHVDFSGAVALLRSAIAEGQTDPNSTDIQT